MEEVRSDPVRFTSHDPTRTADSDSNLHHVDPTHRWLHCARRDSVSCRPFTPRGRKQNYWIQENHSLVGWAIHAGSNVHGAFNTIAAKEHFCLQDRLRRRRELAMVAVTVVEEEIRVMEQNPCKKIQVWLLNRPFIGST